MGISTRTRESGMARPKSANEKWKERWGSWVLRSTILAAVAHAVVLMTWPLWSISYTPMDPLIEMLQILPIMSTGSLSDPEEMALAALPEESEEIEIGPDEGGAGIEEDPADDLSEILGEGPEPSLATSIDPSAGIYGRPAPPLEGDLILEPVTPVTPQVVSLAPAVVWPRIRNPTMIIRFLRTRYNQLLRDPSANGTVAITMWIDERGTVEWAEVRDSSGHPDLDNIALDVFSDVVVFAPARSQGSAVPLGVTISVPFTMPW
ncbi:MAG: TonB family protein [Gemmatimonas sp.]|nr:TonB family protein [Gemmatimonas sp.]